MRNLIANGGMEADISGWGAWLNETNVVQDTYGAHSGTKSVSFTPDVAGGTGLDYTVTVNRGDVFRYAELWFTTPTAGNYFLSIQDGPSTTGFSGDPIAVAADTPTKLWVQPTVADVLPFIWNINQVNFITVRVYRSGGTHVAGTKVAYDDVAIWIGDMPSMDRTHFPKRKLVAA